MKVCSLASSSKGNCTLVYNEDSIILIDMGITKDNQCMQGIGYKELVDYFNSLDNILGSSMAMLGNTVFAIAQNEDAFKNNCILSVEELKDIQLNYFKKS